MNKPEAEAFHPSVEKPRDFEEFWKETLGELARLPLAPELELLPLRCTDFSTVYGVKLTSIGPYRIFAYYSVPHGDGPFPVVYHLPGYGSVVHVPPYEERKESIALSLCARGQRLSDQPFAASYPGLLTTGIDEKSTYIYHGIIADCCRAVDFLLERPEVDKSRIAVTGNDLTLITAALRPQIGAVIVTDLIFYALRDLVPQTDLYPLEEINDYLRFYPEKQEVVYQTLAYFDPLFFAPHVEAPTLVVCQGEGSRFSPTTSKPLMDALSAKGELRLHTGFGHTEHLYQEEWLKKRWANP